MAETLRDELLVDLTLDEEDDEASLQDLLQPLHETAKRVSKQVEDFARSLHKFQAQHTSPSEESWNDARRLFEQFNSITADRLSETRSSQSRSPSATHDGDLHVQLDKLNLECDLWLLASNLLLSRAPQAADNAALSQTDRLKDLHQYASNPELWNAFLDCDIVAQEYETILVWLHERAAKDDAEIRRKIAHTLNRSNRGELDSAVPVYTSHAIKNKKRLVAQSGPLSQGLDGMSSQLDPDAPTRQNARLDPQDEFYESASWQTCWEMLRGGRPVNEIQRWWSDAKEPYRALLCNISDMHSNTAFESPFLRMMNLATNGQWLRLCKEVARDPTIENPIQRAAFGLLCGESGVSDLACEEVDDMVFSLVNGLLIERYLHFVSAYRKKLEAPSQSVYRPLPDDHNVIENLFKGLQSNSDFKEEMQSPHKFIEASLMSMDVVTFLCEMGQGAGHITFTTGRFDHLIYQTELIPVSDCVRMTASDADSVRIVAHLQLALQAIGAVPSKATVTTPADAEILILIENNIASYIGYLQLEKKWSLISLYAAHLSPNRCSSVLGATLIDITDDKEREQQVRLMRKCGVDVPEAIFAIAVGATDPALGQLQSGSFTVEAGRITEKPPKGQTHVRPGFMSDDPTNEEDKAILGVEWYRWVDADNWGKACFSISTLYKLWLVKGRFGALRALAQRAPLGEISLSALSMNLNFGSDQEDEDREDDQIMDDGDEPSGVMSPRKRQEKRVRHPLASDATSRESLYQKSSVWLQLEQLVNALQALETWQELVDTIEA